MATESLVHRRIETAQRRLEAARLLLDKGYTNDALSKAYYAIFAAAKAVLATQGLDSKKHSGVIALFIEVVVEYLKSCGYDVKP
jgi:uncharacterized protein (UPF0332 family)